MTTYEVWFELAGTLTVEADDWEAAVDNVSDRVMNYEGVDAGSFNKKGTYCDKHVA